MGAIRTGEVVAVTNGDSDLVRAEVRVGEDVIEAAGWRSMLGRIEPGHRVAVNTTGIELGLGTGGVGFILWNLDGGGEVDPGAGHVIKLRYTPWQSEVLAAEAPESPHHQVLAEADSILGLPVVACGLHSQIAGVTAGIRAVRPEAVVGYLMTDGGALPVAWSRLVQSLTDAGLIDVSCTVGHAFGGDLEAVNLYSGLAALRHVANTDVAVVAMGPGVVGTGTRLGTTALEQAQILDAAAALQGRPFACVRLSWHDQRARHRGISHHTLTSLRLTAARATVVLPDLEPERRDEVGRQLEDAGLDRHNVVSANGQPGLDLLADRGLEVSSMGRSWRDAPELLAAASAAGIAAVTA
jgi:Protein of unknown function (DUF3866)